jgi:CubicO group peptidase (beta-lactamase class C family)
MSRASRETAAPEYPDGEWRIGDAKETGWSLPLLVEARRAAREFGSIAAIIVHRGRIVAHGGPLSRKVLIRSTRKSLLSALIGIEVQRGRIDLDRSMADLGIDDVPPSLTETEKEATVGDLLKARSGVYHQAVAESEEMKAERPARGSHPRGSHWYYNNWDFNVLGTIYERATGRSVFAGFHDEIAGPTGMEDFHPDDCAYLHGPESEHPAYHFHMSVRDLARFGLLYLHEGRWLNEQIVPEDWVAESTKAHSLTPKGDGYGYMWWTTGHAGEAQRRATAHLNADLPKFRFFAHGGFGQMIGVMPERQLVIVNLARSRPRSAEEEKKLGDFVRLVARAAPR